jgi:hypothetical protein
MAAFGDPARFERRLRIRQWFLSAMRSRWREYTEYAVRPSAKRPSEPHEALR